MRYLIVLGAKLHTLILRARLSKKNESNFQKKFLHSDYQIFISLIKAHKKGPQKSLRAKICDLRVKSLYLRAIMLCIQLLLLLRRSLSFIRKNGSLWALG